jgi:radical SAM protein with 4Fe4S-binding SPASM domain
LQKVHPYAVFAAAMADAVHSTMLSKRRAFHCFAGTHGAIVDYKGDVSACEVLMEDPEHKRIGNLVDYDMNFGELWNSPEAQRTRRLVNCHRACQSCTHETMGLVPSLLFAPNKLGFVFGGEKYATRPNRHPSLIPTLTRDLEARR